MQSFLQAGVAFQYYHVVDGVSQGFCGADDGLEFESKGTKIIPNRVYFGKSFRIIYEMIPIYD